VLCKDALAIGGGTAAAMATVASALMSDHQNYMVRGAASFSHPLLAITKFCQETQKNLVTMGNFSSPVTFNIPLNFLKI
jgi:hypothetical protein